MNLVDRLAPRSLRGRLITWHGLVLGLALIAFALGIYALLSRSLAAEIDRSLADRAQQINNVLKSQESLAPPAEPRTMAVPPPDTFASADIYVQVVTLDGEVMGVSANLGSASLPLDPAELAMLRGGQSSYETVHLDGQRLRQYSALLAPHGESFGIIQVARNLEPLEQARMQLRVLAAVGLLLILGLAALGILLTTNVALRPLSRVVASAELIGASGDLNAHIARSIPAGGSTDEVGRLAAAFDRMLNRLAVADAERREAYVRLERTLEAQRRFVADASHELRTPLTTIRGNAELLRRYAAVTPQDRQAALDQIGGESERLSRIVGDLLTLARADVGQPLTRVPVALGPLLEDVIAQVQLLTRGQELILDRIEPAVVDGDPDALRQLALILLDNAIKFTPPGGRITVGLSIVGDAAWLRVADTGCGIDPVDLPRIFERFYRSERARQAGGTGLGLAIASWIAEQHGGTIRAESTPGQGAEFTAQLPCRRAPAPLDSPAVPIGAPTLATSGTAGQD